MSILIRGDIHKPKNCRRCVYNEDDCRCGITHDGWIDRDDYSCCKPCPIEEVEDTWIPVHNPKTELPKDKTIWVTLYYKEYNVYDVQERYWDMTEWNDPINYVIAYMPYHDYTPKPYGIEEE